jgi:hypothetical protein
MRCTAWYTDRTVAAGFIKFGRIGVSRPILFGYEIYASANRRGVIRRLLLSSRMNTSTGPVVISF